MKLRQFLVLAMVFTFTISLCFAQHQHHQSAAVNVKPQAEPLPDEMKGTAGSVVGFVRDTGCLLRKKDATVIVNEESRKCIQDCTRAGSPLAILTKSGELYLPISSAIPDHDARARLVPYAGKYVRASGRLFERGGMRAIEIEDIKTVASW